MKSNEYGLDANNARKSSALLPGGMALVFIRIMCMPSIVTARHRTISGTERYWFPNNSALKNPPTSGIHPSPPLPTGDKTDNATSSRTTKTGNTVCMNLLFIFQQIQTYIRPVILVGIHYFVNLRIDLLPALLNAFAVIGNSKYTAT